MVENLRILRNAKGMSQQQLADAIGVTQQAIHQYETDKVEPDLENLMRLADTLEVSVDLLIGHQTVDPTSNNLISNEEYSVIDFYRSLNSSDKKTIVRLIKLMSSDKK